MGASIGSEQKKTDVDINVVPFIDLMSCLTAFLLVTVVWLSYAQINVEPRGKLSELPAVNPCVLITDDSVLIGIAGVAPTTIAKIGGLYDWDAVGETLTMFLDSADTVAVRLEVAGEDTVAYQHIIAAMDVAIASGYRSVGYVDPAGLSVQFRE